MKRLLLAAIILVMAAGNSFAGAFVGLGIGTSPATSGEVDRLDFSPDGRSWRLELGYRFGHLSVEGMASQFDMIRADGFGYSDVTLALAAKYGVPLGDKFEAFGRAGLARTDLTAQDTRVEDYGGSGFLLGGGFEYRLDLGAVGGSIFVDYTINRNGVSAPAVYGDQRLSFMTRTWTLGITVSL